MSWRGTHDGCVRPSGLILVRGRFETESELLAVALQDGCGVRARRVLQGWMPVSGVKALGIVSSIMTAMLVLDAVATAAPGSKDPAPVATGVNVATAGDGCTTAPDGSGLADFGAACPAHDDCCSADSTKNRRECDDEFREDLHAGCSRAQSSDVSDPNLRRLAAACHQTADIYYGAVRNRGRSHYEGSGDPA